MNAETGGQGAGSGPPSPSTDSGVVGRVPLPAPRSPLLGWVEGRGIRSPLTVSARLFSHAQCALADLETQLL
jgi:hypothetical protein